MDFRLNCRGENTRRDIVRDYIVTPIAHIRLLNGVVIRSDAEADVRDSYFIFKCVHRNTKDNRIIQCGRGAARDFFRLTNTTAPPIFNPLVNENDNGGGDGGNDINDHEENQWNPATKQLYNAVMLIIICWNAKPNTALFDIQANLMKYYNRELPLFRAKQVNNILNNKKHPTTIQDIINKLRENNNLREYHFNLVTELLENNDTPSFFGN